MTVAGKSDDAHEGSDAKAPAKSKKLLLILVGVVLVLAIAGGGAFFYISKQRAAAEDTEVAVLEPVSRPRIHPPVVGRRALRQQLHHQARLGPVDRWPWVLGPGAPALGGP